MELFMARGACVRDCMESGVRTVERRSGETRQGFMARGVRMSEC